MSFPQSYRKTLGEYSEVSQEEELECPKHHRHVEWTTLS
jgi:hypothetical protein